MAGACGAIGGRVRRHQRALCARARRHRQPKPHAHAAHAAHARCPGARVHLGARARTCRICSGSSPPAAAAGPPAGPPPPSAAGSGAPPSDDCRRDGGAPPPLALLARRERRARLLRPPATVEAASAGRRVRSTYARCSTRRSRCCAASARQGWRHSAACGVDATQHTRSWSGIAVGRAGVAAAGGAGAAAAAAARRWHRRRRGNGGAGRAAPHGALAPRPRLDGLLTPRRALSPGAGHGRRAGTPRAWACNARADRLAPLAGANRGAGRGCSARGPRARGTPGGRVEGPRNQRPGHRPRVPRLSQAPGVTAARGPPETWRARGGGGARELVGGRARGRGPPAAGARRVLRARRCRPFDHRIVLPTYAPLRPVARSAPTCDPTPTSAPTPSALASRGLP